MSAVDFHWLIELYYLPLTHLPSYPIQSSSRTALMRTRLIRISDNTSKLRLLALNISCPYLGLQPSCNRRFVGGVRMLEPICL